VAHQRAASDRFLIRGISQIATERLGVLVVMCTNRADALDPAVRRERDAERDARYAQVAAQHNATVSQVAVAQVLALSPTTLTIPGTGSRRCSAPPAVHHLTGRDRHLKRAPSCPSSSPPPPAAEPVPVSLREIVALSRAMVMRNRFRPLAGLPVRGHVRSSRCAGPGAVG